MEGRWGGDGGEVEGRFGERPRQGPCRLLHLLRCREVPYLDGLVRVRVRVGVEVGVRVRVRVTVRVGVRV